MLHGPVLVLHSRYDYRAVNLATDVGMSGVAAERPHFRAVEGGLVMTERRRGKGEDARLRFFVGTPDAALAERTLPEGAKQFAMATVSRGLAIGDDASAIWFTVDGGEHWEPLDVPVDGSPAAVRLQSGVVCTNAACFAPPFVWADVGRYGSPVPRPLRIVAPAKAPAEFAAPHSECYFLPKAASHELPGAEEAINCPSSRKCIIDRQWLSGLHAADLERQARIVPSQQEGITRGFKFYGLRRGSLPKLLGFKNGDMVVRIGKVRITSRDRLERGVASLLRGGDVQGRVHPQGQAQRDDAGRPVTPRQW